MVNTTKREIFSQIRALTIQAYLGHTAYRLTNYMVYASAAAEEARSCSDLGKRALKQSTELMDELYSLIGGHPNWQYYNDELDALCKKYRPAHPSSSSW